MRLACSILLLTALASPAGAQTSGGAASRQSAREVSTVRSDGALYSGARQRPRRERARTSDITTSRRLLDPAGQWRSEIEPVDGGQQVAPVDGRGDNSAATPVVIVVDQPVRPQRLRGRQ
ncbi:MAG: hypothetical protein MUF14_07965 [Hyphomonadaceae bacterium]|jgi:hypothetical protein|nr:hypothetical protein [Hyphomonadaceae bacterium]